jgi:predicted XRE-type DNA-binding protein
MRKRRIVTEIMEGIEAMKSHREGTIAVHQGSGNIFADLGLPKAEKRLAKANLGIRIAAAIRKRHITQACAARILKIDQTKLSRLLRGQLSRYSTERLMYFLTLLEPQEGTHEEAS